MSRFFLKKGLLVSAAALVTAATGAMAQTVTTSNGEHVELEEIIVTATRQATSLNRTPLSITAMTQDSMERQGVQDADDLARMVPGLTVSNHGSNSGVQTIAIRGITPSTGAATTGVYLDDAPLTKRGGPAGSGTPIPMLFDLERVEVLRGPQGTLYGGGSQGGTVRFITPEPSLTDYSGSAKAGLSNTKEGDWSYEGGAAVGGPIVEDKLGFRASAMGRHKGGYIDYVDRLTAKTLEKDANSTDEFAARLALAFAPTEQTRITPSVYWSRQEINQDDYYWRNVAQSTAPARPNNPAHTYGPYNFYGRYRSGDTCNIGDNFVGKIAPCMPDVGVTNNLFVSSIKAETELDDVKVMGVVSYLKDSSTGNRNFSYQEPQNHQAGSPFIATLPIYESYPWYDNDRDGYTAELRFSSDYDDSRVSWVGGIFYSNMTIKALTEYRANVGDLTQAIYGLRPEDIFGVPLLPGNLEYYRDYDMTDNEIAAYGEMTFAVTDSFKLIGGLRLSRTHLDYRQLTAGPIVGTSAPTAANGGVITGQIIETPVSPKVGFQYLIDGQNSIFGTVSSGYRAGGVNQTPPSRCATDLTTLGISSTPSTYQSDKVWNYELGAKVNILGVQVNSSVYRLEWNDTQTNYGLPTCGFTYAINAGKAVSQGLDLDARAALGGGFTANLAVGYADAEYKQGVVGPAPVSAVYLKKGDPLPIPDWKISVGLQYDFDVAGRDGFIRADYQYASSYWSGVTYGSVGYSPDAAGEMEATNYVSMRAGYNLTDKIELGLFVDNLLNSNDVLAVGDSNGRSGCVAASGPSCSQYRQFNPVYREMTFRPRTMGATATYRF